MNLYRARYAKLLSLVVLGLLSLPTHAQEKVVTQQVDIPLKINHQLITQLISDQLFSSQTKTVKLADDGLGCQYLELSSLKTATHNQYLRLRATTYARFGTVLGGQCILLWEWRGQIEVDEALSVVNNGDQIQAQIVKSRLLTMDGRVDEANNAVWQWVSPIVKPTFEKIYIDIRQPIRDTKTVLSQTMANLDPVVLGGILDSIKVADIAMYDKGVGAVIRVSLPAAPNADAATAKQLSNDEVALLIENSHRVDAFMTFIAKNIALETKDADLRQELLEILLAVRYDLQEIIVSEQTNYTQDPVKQVFIDTWQRLIPLLNQLASEQNSAVAAMNYLSFIAAGEALSLIDQVGPHFGVDLSVEGLRRLARIIVLNSPEDPTNYADDVDETLRRVFGFGDAMTVQLPPSSSLLDWLVRPAWAATGFEADFLEKLNNSLPKRNELDTYLERVNRVLHYVAHEKIIEGNIKEDYRALFETLVYATAWQESCWRQYVNDKGKRLPLKSAQGDVGLMQVNARVWRGFYNLEMIKWDIAYNAKAGTEILYHYFNDYALRKKEHKVAGKVDDLARASYSAYNGGPKSLSRYRNPKASEKLKRVDASFYKKYKEMKKLDHKSVLSCF